jgi:hypothetical protein
MVELRRKQTNVICAVVSFRHVTRTDKSYRDDGVDGVSVITEEIFSSIRRSALQRTRIPAPSLGLNANALRRFGRSASFFQNWRPKRRTASRNP